MKHFVGCAGWRFGNFYPQALAPREYLSHYSRVFDVVEVGVPATYEHSFWRWAHETPEGFRFVVRIPEQAAAEEDSVELGNLLEAFRPIEEKTLAVVIRTPQGLTLQDGRRWLDRVLATSTYHGYSAILDFAHPSWFQDTTYNVLRRHGAAMYWRSGRNVQEAAVAITSDFIFLRLSGNAGNWKAEFEMALKEAGQDGQVDMSIIIADSPGGANAALTHLGLPERKYAGPMPAPALPVPAPRWSPGSRMILCVDLNAFYPSCEELREPALKGRPHAVIMTDQPAGKITRGVVSSCSYEARRFGVRSAMPLARALALCPDMDLRPVDIAYYKQVSEKVMEVLSGFADVIEQASIDEAFLDCTARAAAGDASPYEYASSIKRAIRERCGLSVSIGVAPSKSAAKIASDFKKPDDITVAYPDRLQDFLAPLEVGRISGIGPKTQQELKKIGIATIGQLAACDVQKLTSRFGSRNGLWMWQVATGADSDPVVPREDHVSISTEHSLEVHAKGRKEVLAELTALSDELYARVAGHGYLFRTVGAKIVRADFSIETREMSYQGPQQRRESILAAIPQLVDRFDLDAPVRKVGLRVTNLSHPGRQEAQRTLLDFFAGQGG
ncbi:DNA polymerase IV [Nitrososphaera viennensis]|mgnify:CR=1 FL=1|uniref:DNA polymerase IV n=1 Tax=Nitrososphaera viennensis TaxID=1034015 RepID=A0A977NM07_9ARCH|nr:DNA polymerase IV [Nitrososphaera viennensis]UVS69379.1 DNA polymerase IV [Nitrososphaera viennensis]